MLALLVLPVMIFDCVYLIIIDHPFAGCEKQNRPRTVQCSPALGQSSATPAARSTKPDIVHRSWSGPIHTLNAANQLAAPTLLLATVHAVSMSVSMWCELR